MLIQYVCEMLLSTIQEIIQMQYLLHFILWILQPHFFWPQCFQSDSCLCFHLHVWAQFLPTQTQHSASLSCLYRVYHSQLRIASELLFSSANSHNHLRATRSFCLPELLISCFLFYTSSVSATTPPPPLPVIPPGHHNKTSYSIKISDYLHMIVHHVFKLESGGFIKIQLLLCLWECVCVSRKHRIYTDVTSRRCVDVS